MMLLLLGCAADPYDDPSCHYDCFRTVACADGEVELVVNAPVPCAEWTGSCPTMHLGTCPAGCGDRAPVALYPWQLPWQQWCEGTEQRLAGDPCTTDDDCAPPAPVPADGGMGDRRVRLGCDMSRGVCEEVPVPVPSDFGDACSATFDSLSSPSGSAAGVVADPTCESGWCGFTAREAPDCDLHGCAIACEEDWDCPEGMRCAEVPDWTGRTVEEGAGGVVRVCDDPVRSWVTCH
jgi:hypothetical protein